MHWTSCVSTVRMTLLFYQEPHHHWKYLFWGCLCTDPNVRAVISCLMSGPAGAEHGGCWGSPEGTLPPGGCSGTGVGCLNGPHLPLPGKVTSWSSSFRLSTAQWAYPFIWRGLLGGTVNSHCAISCKRSFMSCQSSLSLRSTKLCLETMQCTLTWRSLLGRSVQLSIP